VIDTMLLNGLWQGALIVAIAALATWKMPQGHAATRHAVWFAALVALIVVPIVSMWHPAAAVTALPAPMQHTAAAPSLVIAKAASASGTWLLMFWVTGAMLALIRLGLSWARINRIVRDAALAPELGVNVMTSTGVDLPIAARLVFPVIVLPARLLRTLDRSDLDGIIRHERAHIARRDILANLIQRVIEALLFFNPWAYIIGRALIAEREAACDDWAVQASGEPDRYASCLARLAQNPRASRTPLLTPSAIGSRRMLVERIARLLNGKAIQLKINYIALGASVLAFGVLAVALQTVTGLAADASLPLGSDVAVAASPCVGTGADVKILNAVPPNIPKSAFRPNTAANALVTISPSGRPISAKIALSSGSAGMDSAVVKAALASTYSPAMNACKYITSQYLFKAVTGPM
jgi:TonB family protein